MEDINNINLVIMDGHLKINNIKIYISLFIKVKIIIIIKNQFNFLKGTEIFLIFFTIFLGINLLLLSNDLLIFTISWELFNLSLYLLVSLNNYSSESSLSASLKYFILSALSTGFLLLGVSLIYYMLGSTSFDNIISSFDMLNPVYTDLIIFLILSTFIFKLGAAPFYNWAPDLYNSLNSNITMWMIIIPKITVLSLIYLWNQNSLINFNSPTISSFLALAGILSLIIGSIGLINQWNIKRFLAYSGISNVGFIILALYSNDLNSYLIYLIIYSITTVNIFTILLIFSRYLNTEIFNISQLIGLHRTNPFLSFAFAISFFSLAG
jgi:NADH-quinone oxidoreductase subunit N